MQDVIYMPRYVYELSNIMMVKLEGKKSMNKVLKLVKSRKIINLSLKRLKKRIKVRLIRSMSVRLKRLIQILIK